jgi:penicillin V acylase-like amidase (Ntn superfamily)
MLKVISVIVISVVLLCPIREGNTAAGEDNATVPVIRSQACTSFAASFGETVLFGNTEDHASGMPLYEDPEGATIWFFPASDSNYGFMQLGWYWQGRHISFQGGMNDQGLAYDVTGVPELPMNPHPDRPYSFGTDDFFAPLLRECANVSEAIDLINQFDFETWWGQFFLADRSGAAVIVGPGPDGEMALTWKGSGDGYLVASNFNAVLPESNMGGDSFKRYDTAMAMLEGIQSEDDLTMERFQTILDAVHRESSNPFSGTFTMYANTFDLRNSVAYLYYLSDFSEVVKFNLKEELTRGAQVLTLSELVSQQTREQALARFQSIKTRGRVIIIGIIVAILLVLAGVSLLIFKKVRKRWRVRQYRGVEVSDRTKQ